MKRAVGLFLTLMSISAFSFADPNPNDVYLLPPSYGGTGCPQNTASVSLSNDAKALSILFDRYVAQAGREVGRSMDRKTCNIAVPVHVPQGFSVSIFSIDYRGFNTLPFGAYSQFSVEYFFAGGRGPSFTKTFNGALNSDYLLNNQLTATAVIWSQCGQEVILRTNTSMFLQTNARMDPAMSTVDSVDLTTSGVIYHLQWRRC